MQYVRARRRLAGFAVRPTGKRYELLAGAPDRRHAVARVDDVLSALDEEVGEILPAIDTIVEGKVELVHELLNFDVVHGGQGCDLLCHGFVSQGRQGDETAAYRRGYMKHALMHHFTPRNSDLVVRFRSDPVGSFLLRRALLPPGGRSVRNEDPDGLDLVDLAARYLEDVRSR